MSKKPKSKKNSTPSKPAGRGVTLRLSREEHSALEKEAAANLRTVQQQARWRLLHQEKEPVVGPPGPAGPMGPMGPAAAPSPDEE